MDTESVWKKISKRSKTYPTLSRSLEVDVAIVGGGVTGMTAALFLLNAGKKVAILEAEEIGGVTTGFSTGNLYVAVQPYYQTIIKKWGLDTAKAVSHSRKEAIDWIEKTIHERQIDCAFSRRPWYLFTNDEKKVGQFDEEIKAFKAVHLPLELLDQLPLGLSFKKAAVIPNQARLNPLQYVMSVTDSLANEGCLVFENTRVTSVKEGDKCLLETSAGHSVTAKKVIIATHTPIGIHSIHLFSAPYRSYVVAARLKQPLSEMHLWDLEDPHHSICSHVFSKNEPELLLVSGSHHKVGQEHNALSHYKALEKFIRERFSVEEIIAQWSSQHYQSADELPYIGLANRFSHHTYIATGYFADGLVYGTVAARIVSDLILEKENALSKIYSPSRFTMASTGFLIKENANVMAQYCKDLPKKTFTQFGQIKTGEGKVVELDQEKWGVFKDEQQQLHIVSAVCPHMKCIVNWNNAEKTWDCPCHGSRFTIEGQVIEGPATANLKKKETL